MAKSLGNNIASRTFHHIEISGSEACYIDFNCNIIAGLQWQGSFG